MSRGREEGNERDIKVGKKNLQGSAQRKEDKKEITQRTRK